MPIDEIRKNMRKEGLDAFIVSQIYNLRYLSKFTGSNGTLIITPHERFLLTDFRYYQQAEQQSPDWTLVQLGNDPKKRFSEFLNEQQFKTIGFEADFVTVAQLNEWQEKSETINFVSTTDWVMDLRAVKTPSEIIKIRRAVALADETIEHLYNWIKPGMTEKEVAWELEVFVRTHGGDGLAFPPIVAVNENSSKPHASISDHRIELGDVVLIDMGCIIDGYNSDVTRTFSLGEPKHPDFLKIWDLVHHANQTAATGIKAGMLSKDADALARDLIASAGYGDMFGHSLGHGVGANVHEKPALSSTKDYPLETGNVVTIEPGIYLQGEFGVRLEDIAIITQTGVQVLTSVRKIAILDK